MLFDKLVSYICVFVDQDGAEPSSNSVSAMNLLRLSSFLDRSDLKKMAEKIFFVFSDRLEKVPIALPAMMSALLFYHSTPKQVKRIIVYKNITN